MPKKRSSTLHTKPATSAHPSLATSNTHVSQNDNVSDRSVNDLIQHLRQSQVSAKTSTNPHQASTRTVHPSLRDILQITDTPIPRPRAGMVRNRRRGLAGPPPPKSWLVSTVQASTSLRDSRVQGTRQNSDLPVVQGLGRLPGMEDRLPEEQSLVHQTLKALACNWNWHVEYDQCYLATLPIRYKEALLAYIAVYSRLGINVQGLKTLLFDETELEDATGSETLTHLDLAASIGHALSVKDLSTFFIETLPTKTSHPNTVPSSTPDSWDLPSSTPVSHSLKTPGFLSLTHLSLSHPLSKPSLWRSLLSLLPHLTTLTHLSLAYWPAPWLASNANASYIGTPYGTINHPPANFYAGTCFGDWVEAGSILRRLSKATCCLKWLDLTGCGPWMGALDLGTTGSGNEIKVHWGSSDSERTGSIDWCGGWRSLETVVVVQGWIPECLQSKTAGRNVLCGEGIEGRKEGDDGSVWDTGEERRKWKMKSELQTWLAIECDIEAVERGVMTNMIGGVMKKRLNGGCRPVRFERGWEGWWIEDLIKDYGKKNYKFA